ncbi:hypothetical protein QBC40DRAFT_255574 [Triangularia verruculosa]|uniref:FAD-binding domain-containing protein n=1 Tax=Triangularia verruculosa TaxID=2587418 RepID=A0AAN6XJE6_9PEZI|nr:hypothetical protein QBC40DRAFT_255574 [Triangularia verruculosa]
MIPLVIGADGVHSKTRRIMNTLSSAPEPGALPSDTPSKVVTTGCANKVGLTQPQKGAVKNRNWKRIGLVGDACDKITPNVGLGYSNGVMDVIVLGNLLEKLNESGEEAIEEAVVKLFKEYQEERREITAKMDQPRAGLDKMYGAKVMRPLMAKQQVLEWLEEENGIDGSIPWAHKGLVVTKA